MPKDRAIGQQAEYDFVFIDYGSKLALYKRADPSKRVIYELTGKTATAQH